MSNTINRGSVTSKEEKVYPIMTSNRSEGFSFQLTLEKLNSKNFREWAQSIKLFSSFQTSGHSSSTYISLRSLAHRGNFLKALSIISRSKNYWIIDYSASDHMVDSYHLLPLIHLVLEIWELKFQMVHFLRSLERSTRISGS